MKLLISFRSNDLFDAYMGEIITGLGVDQSDILIFPRGTEEDVMESELISKIPASESQSINLICDATVGKILHRVGLAFKSKKVLDHYFSGTFNLGDCATSVQEWIDNAKALLSILNPDNRKCVIVLERLASHLPQRLAWLFSYYKVVEGEIKHVVVSEESGEAEAIYFTHLSAKINISKEECDRILSEVWHRVAEFINENLHLDARIVAYVPNIFPDEFVIVDRHAYFIDDIAPGNRLLLPLDSSFYEASRLGLNIEISHADVVKRIIEKLTS